MNGRSPKLKPVVLITGGSAGIGAACVRKFLSEEWNVAVLALPNQDIEWLEREKDVVVTVGDVTSNSAREAAVHQALLSFGRVDVLINNAGIGLYAMPTDIPLDLFTTLLEINTIAPLALAQLLVPVMLRQRSGVIVTIGSVAGAVALPWAAAYSASKSAMHSMHDALRRELRGTPVHVVKVCLGIVDTGFRNHVLCGRPPERVRDIRWIVSPDAVATNIFHAVQKRRSCVYVPKISRFFTGLGAVFPGLMDLYLSRFQPYVDGLSNSGSRTQEKDIRGAG